MICNSCELAARVCGTRSLNAHNKKIAIKNIPITPLVQSESNANVIILLIQSQETKEVLEAYLHKCVFIGSLGPEYDSNRRPLEHTFNLLALTNE
jgi:hypothetical protein